MGPAGLAIGAVWGIGLAVDALAREFEHEKPPEGANWTDYKSIMIGHQLEQAFPGTIQKAQNPLQLLGLALSGPALSPHGEQPLHQRHNSIIIAARPDGINHVMGRT